MVKSKDSECISFLHPLLWMLPHPPRWGMTEILWSLLSAILSFCSAVIWTASHVGDRTLRFDSHVWFVLIGDAGVSEGIVAILSLPQWGRVSGTGYPNLTPAPVLLGVPISLCCGGVMSSHLTSAWPSVYSQGHLWNLWLSSHSASQGPGYPSGWEPDQWFTWIYKTSLVSGCDPDAIGLWVVLCTGPSVLPPTHLVPHAVQNLSWFLCSAQCMRGHRLPARL